MSSSFVLFFFAPGMSQRLQRLRQMFARTLFASAQETKWRLLALSDDELIIYEMSAVMKIGRLPGAAPFTVTEPFTSLITPGASPLRRRAESGPDAARGPREDHRSVVSPAGWRECPRISMEFQTDKIHETQSDVTHTRAPASEGRRRRRPVMSPQM